MSGKSFIYAALACVTGPIGGAIAGYQYARNKQRLEALDPSEKRSWDNATGNVIVGVIFAPIAGALFAWACAEQENKIARLESDARYASMNSSVRANYATFEPQLVQNADRSQWRDYVQQQELPPTSLGRN